MPFVKLDCGILNSTTWVDKDTRDVFITALLLAEPFELKEATDQIKVRSLEDAGFEVPAGWYGFVPSASLGIIRHAMIDEEAGLAALERLGSPDQESRTPDYDGRRMVRVDGGYLILNYQKYRDKDHTAAERQRRYRERQKTLRCNVVDVTRNITQAEEEVEADINKTPMSGKPDAKEILAFLNEKTGKNFQPVKSNLTKIQARLKEYSEDQLRQVIAKKCREWGGDEKMVQYLRPATLFNAEKCAQYVGELV